MAGTGAAVFEKTKLVAGLRPQAAKLIWRCAAFPCLVVLGLLLSWGAYCEGIIWTDGSPRPRQPETAALAQALRRSPRDWWLLYQVGRSELETGQPASAVSHLQACVQLNARCQACAIYLAWAEALSGNSQKLSRMSEPADADLRFILDVMKAHASSRAGRDKEALAHMEEAYAEYQAGHVVRHQNGAQAAEYLQELNSFKEFAAYCLGAAAGATPAAMPRLLEALAKREGLSGFDPRGLAPAFLCPYYQR
jgi:tetratricopeptide (TPR) repeat protein